MDVYYKQFIMFTVLCLATAQKRNFLAQRGTNVRLYWRLSQSVSQEFCVVKKDKLTIFNILMGQVTTNTNHNRYRGYDSFVSTEFQFSIFNVSYSDAGLYSVLRKDGGTNYGEVGLVVTDYPVSSPERKSKSTVNIVVGVVVTVVVSLIVIMLIVLKRQRLRQITLSQFQTNDFGAKTNNSSTYENFADGVSFSSLQPYHVYPGNTYNSGMSASAEVTDDKSNDSNSLQNDTATKIKTETEQQSNTKTEQQTNTKTEQQNNTKTEQQNNTKTEQQRNTKPEQTKPNQLLYIEVSFDDNKKTDEQPVMKIQSDNTRTTYEEVDFNATANLANT